MENRFLHNRGKTMNRKGRFFSIVPYVVIILMIIFFAVMMHLQNKQMASACQDLGFDKASRGSWGQLDYCLGDKGVVGVLFECEWTKCKAYPIK